MYKPVHAKYYWHTEHKHRGMDFVRKNTTLSWYIEYMKSRIKEGYRGVSDFSNSNGDLPRQFLKQIAPVLQEEFDVRVTMIWRHPVRRSYSQISNWYKNMTDNDNAPKAWKIRDPEKAEHWQNIKKTYPDSISYWKSQIVKPSRFFVPDYVTNFEKWSVFDNVYAIVMEEAWKDPSGLSDFIGHKIDKMHVNVYYPERGTKRPEIKGLRDQWSSDMQDLSSSDLQEGRCKLDWIYKNFKEKFGYIPYQWE
tara:strand:- start:168 stop:917 length:750 start_codon:yes stop_codon:yes gene_type:complete